MPDQPDQPTPAQAPVQGEPPAPAEQPNQPERAGSNTATAVKTAPTPTRPRLDRLPPYRVLLPNDEAHDMLEVVETIVELTPLNRQRATLAMLEAHTTGLALLLVTHKERAELYRDQFLSKTLTVTIEQAE